MSPWALLVVGMLAVVVAIGWLKWHPFIALFGAALLVAGLTAPEQVYWAQLKTESREALRALPPEQIGSAPVDLQLAHGSATKVAKTWFVTRVVDAFGKGCGSFAIIIAMAAIVGKCLLDSGAARRIVESLMALLGLRRTPIALALSAFTLGIPVFFDTVFFLMMPLVRALRERTGKDYLLYILTVVAGATMAHSLVPPTPGPLTVAGFFGDQVSIGSMMIGGLIVGAGTVSAGVAYAYWANLRWEIDLPTLDGAGESAPVLDRLPTLGFSLLPVLLPLVLIAGQTICDAVGFSHPIVKFLGDKHIALMLAAGVAVFLLIRSGAVTGGSTREAVQSALASGGTIILVTAAGSAFGVILGDTGIAETISASIPHGQSLWLLPLAYLITALVRTAQGSATVAMITAGGIVAPIAMASPLAYAPIYLALAIGCGSKPISWANDSGFWLIGRMSGMTPIQTFKTVSIMMIIMSLVGLAMVLLGAVLLPLR